MARISPRISLSGDDPSSVSLMIDDIDLTMLFPEHSIEILIESGAPPRMKIDIGDVELGANGVPISSDVFVRINGLRYAVTGLTLANGAKINLTGAEMIEPPS